jgi:HlyD family secretion protein
VNASGSIRSADAVVIKNRVEGQTKILWIIEEGTRVQAGDKLIELDSSSLADEKLEEEIEVESSRADYVNAQQRLEITKKQGQANIEAAQVEYNLSLLDLEKYAGIDAEAYLRSVEEGSGVLEAMKGSILGELNELAATVATDSESREKFQALLEEMKGSYKLELKKAFNNILLAEAEVKRARDRHMYSEKLYSKGYISGSELEADRLDLIRREMDQEVAAEELELLAEFTYRRTMEELLSAVNQRDFELEKATHEAEANVVDAQANMHARQERLVRDEQQLREILEQLEACVVRAPQAGMVVYGTTGQDRWDREEPLDEGVDVRERQDLFRLPTTDNLVADIKIHESMLEYVHEGLPVRVTSDAVPDRVYSGAIQKIAVLPDAQSRWLNPDLKVYNTIVEIQGDTEGLRTGISCKAEVIIDELEDALYLPIQCVVRIEGQPVVYLPDEEGGLAAHAVEVGLDDKQMIQILSGLEEGQMVSLSPPLKTGESGKEEAEEELPEGDEGKPPRDSDRTPDRGPRTDS